MSSLMAFVAPLVLAAAAPQAAAPLAEPIAAADDGADPGWAIWRLIAEAFRAPAADQVRIEQHMVIRITPLGPQRELLADLPRAPLATKFHERKVGKCVPVAGIAGVQIAGDDRLLLFMRDQRLIGANLEKACRARDFYSGFYVAKNGDGRLCVDRDMIHARSGASCSVSKLRQLVAVDDD
jgi:hypothetical protein